jgi:hypothetical protein|nr:MAG TPA: DNA-directed RNA polymerase subunit alpha [Caudoviricetes sp.]
MPIASFFILEVVEVVKLLEKMRSRIEYEHKLQFVAISNALGSAFNKNYKYNDLFENKKAIKKEVTQEEREELKAYFESW